MLKKRVNLFGVLVDDINMEEAKRLAEESLMGDDARSFFTPNLEFIDGARRSRKTRELLNGASVLLPDGFSLRVLSFLLGEKLKNTVAGIDFGEELLNLAESTGKGVFLLGGREDVAYSAAKKLQKKHPDLLICGTHHGYFTDDELDGICKKINSSGAEILIVCRGFPRQEKFVCETEKRLGKIRVFVCLGGALDVWSGEIKRAPMILRKLHLEWLWRIFFDFSRAERFAFSLQTLFYALGCALRIKPYTEAYN